LKNISILGSTGSIGTQTLEVVDQHPDKFRVSGLGAATNLDTLAGQIKKYSPEIVSVIDQSHAIMLSEKLNGNNVEIVWGEEGYKLLATLEKTDLVVSAMVGASGLKPTFSAIKEGKNVALANKESLVIAGEILLNESSGSKCRIIPVDSEHSALFQALDLNGSEFVKRIIITASGGPFRDKSITDLERVTVKSALEHPTWKMGAKITIDSATLMNKGFEVIEAKWLFNIPAEKIDVWIHPQSIVHSMVEYIDGSFISQLSVPDMKIPIAYALSYPDRVELSGRNINPADFSNLSFENVDKNKFQSLRLAKSALMEGGTMPAVLNASNEIAVQAFLNKKIKFTDIMRIVEKTMQDHNSRSAKTIDDIFDADSWARAYARTITKYTGE